MAEHLASADLLGADGRRAGSGRVRGVAHHHAAAAWPLHALPAQGARAWPSKG